MTQRRFILTLGAVAIAAGGLTWWSYQRLFAGPISTARTQTAQLTARVSELQDSIKKTATSRSKLAAISGSTLGKDAESVVHELRVALSEIGANASLAGVVVDSRALGEQKSPASKAFSESKQLRDSIDFGVVEGTLRGSATYQQAAQAIALVESQAWPKRVRSVSLEPTSTDANAPMSFAMVVETLYLPGMKPKAPADSKQAMHPMAPERAEVVQRIAAHNLFTRPGPIPQVAAAPAVIPAPTGQWIVTGWAEGSTGWELWIRSTRDQQTRSVRVGERVQDGTFVGVRDGYAVVDSGGQHFAIALGEPVEARDRRIE